MKTTNTSLTTIGVVTLFAAPTTYAITERVTTQTMEAVEAVEAMAVAASLSTAEVWLGSIGLLSI